MQRYGQRPSSAKETAWSKLTTPIYYGHFECKPARFNWIEAWVFNIHRGYPRTWREFDAFEVLWHAGVMTEAEFRKDFGPLPPLPEHAFKK